MSKLELMLKEAKSQTEKVQKEYNALSEKVRGHVGSMPIAGPVKRTPSVAVCYKYCKQ